MQFAQISVFIPTAVIIEPIGDVGGLLHLADETPRADGVHRTRRKEIRVPLPHGYPVQDLHERIVRDPAAQLLGRDVAVEPDVNTRALLRVQNIPHLALAVLPLHGERILVGGMHLYGEILLGVDELDHDGELFIPLRLPAEPLFSDDVNVFGKGHPRELPFGDRRFPVGMRGERPTLGDDLHVPDVFVENVADLRSAPKIIFKDGRKFDEQVDRLFALVRARPLTADGTQQFQRAFARIDDFILRRIGYKNALIDGIIDLGILAAEDRRTLQNEKVCRIPALALIGDLFALIDDDFADLDLIGRVQRLRRTPCGVTLGLYVEIAFLAVVIFLPDALRVRFARLIGNIDRVARVDDDDISETVRHDQLAFEHIDDFHALAVISDRVIVVFGDFIDVLVERGDIRDARPLERCRDEIALVGAQDLGEAHGRDGRVGDELSVFDAQLRAALHRSAREHGEQDPRLDRHDPAVPQAVFSAFGAARNHLPADVDKIIAFPRVRRFADDDRHSVPRGDLLDLRDARRIVAVHQTFGRDDEQLLVRIALLCIGDDGRRGL